MNAYEKIEKLNGKDFKLIAGAAKEVFTKVPEGVLALADGGNAGIPYISKHLKKARWPRCLTPLPPREGLPLNI